MNNIIIKTEYIKLDSFLKLAGVAASGGEAKQLVLDSLVSVNGETCLQRGKKLRPGDVVSVSGGDYTVAGDAG